MPGMIPTPYSRCKPRSTDSTPLRPIFEELGVRPDGFSLLRQHSLCHYIKSIRLFSAPNGLCSSITESKHIVAVKRPWRASSRYHPIEQIIQFKHANDEDSCGAR